MAKRVKIEESVDRISSLPDSILGHILSFLPTKVAVSTCILLTRSRWRDLFPFSNNLDFVQSLGNNANETNLFMDFVDRIIMLMNGTPIDKFCLKCSYSVDTSRVHSWIAPLLRNVRELDLCIGWRQPGKEYSCVFTCNTLLVLRLGTGFSLNLPASVCFPCLKTLHLQSVRLANKDSPIQTLVSSCPVLEDLLVDGCYMGDVHVLSLSSPSLKRLTLHPPMGRRPYKLVLDTPSLVYLKFSVSEQGNIFKNLHYLREVRIHIGYLANHELLDVLGNVKSLYLSGFVQKYLQTRMIVSEELPLLKNLTRLVINDGSYSEMSGLMKLLQCCPNLEEFIINGSLRGGCQNVPCCLPSRLNYIECALYLNRRPPYDHKEKVELLEYFLKNANMLEKMHIHIWYSCVVSEKLFGKTMESLKKLAKVPRRSKTCEINVFLDSNVLVEDQLFYISEFSAFNSFKINEFPLYV